MRPSYFSPVPADDDSQQSLAESEGELSGCEAADGTPTGRRRDATQLPKKRYQKAGLFSNTYKEDEWVMQGWNMQKSVTNWKWKKTSTK